MKRPFQVLDILVLGALLGGATGCASLDTVENRLDRVGGRYAETVPHEYEGQIQEAQRYGAMFALQFAGGKMYDVEEAPPGLVRGDIVRIYKTKKGYKAHLVRSST